MDVNLIYDPFFQSPDQDVNHFGPGKLRRWLDRLLQHFPHLGPRQHNMVLFGMGTGLEGGHPITTTAEKAMFEKEGGDP